MSFAFLSSARKALAAPDLAVDLGSANTRVCDVQGRLFREIPSSVGSGTQPGTGAVFPLSRGVVNDIDAAAALLEPIFFRARGHRLMRPRALACIPVSAKEDARDALVRAARQAGASAVAVTPEPLAAAIGAGIDVGSPWAQLVADIGDGVTEIVLIRGGQILHHDSLQIACSDLRSAIRQALIASHDIDLDRLSADQLLQQILRDSGAPNLMLVEGTDRSTGSDIAVCVDGSTLAESVRPFTSTIVEFIDGFARALPVRYSVEAIETGICLTGGGACLSRLRAAIETRTRLDVHLPANPLHAVIRGAESMLRVASTVSMSWH